MSATRYHTMRRHWLIAIVPGILLAGLGAGWAASAFEPPIPPLPFDDPELFETMSRYHTEADAHIEADYGDCTLGFEHGSHFIANGSSNIALNCGFRLGGGASGGGGDDLHPSLLSKDFHSDVDHIKWERDGIEFCSLETTSHVRSADNGPNTLLITINCWWFDDQKETIILNSTLADRPLESLADEASHAILGVVTQINPTSQNLTGYNRTVFTDVAIAVNENLKGTYEAPIITVRFEGGETQDLMVINKDAPRFKVGESVFVLVNEPEPDGIHGDRYSLAGLYQGKYTIEKSGFAENRDYNRSSSLGSLANAVVSDLAHF